MQNKAERSARWAATAIGFSVPISVALDNALMLAVLVLWLASGKYAEKYRIIRENPVAIAAFSLFCLLAAGMFWGATPLHDALGTLGKYIDLLYVPIFITLFDDPSARRNAMRAFLASMLLTLLLSYLIRLGILHENAVIRGFVANPYVFKLHITQNFFMSFAAMMLAWFAIDTKEARIRWGWIVLAALAAINVLFMVQGRIGYVVIAMLLLFFFVNRFGARGVVAGFLATSLLATAAYYGSGEFRMRVSTATSELSHWHRGQAVADTNSIGSRLEFYANTLSIIRDHPFIGVGTGGFEGAYAEKVKGTDMLATHNPHDEFLLVMAQTGIFGLSLLLLLFLTQWKCAGKLPVEQSFLGRGLVLAMISGCLFNSFLLDHAEGLFFAWMSGVLFSGRTVS